MMPLLPYRRRRLSSIRRHNLTNSHHHLIMPNTIPSSCNIHTLLKVAHHCHQQHNKDSPLRILDAHLLYPQGPPITTRQQYQDHPDPLVDHRSLLLLLGRHLPIGNSSNSNPNLSFNPNNNHLPNRDPNPHPHPT